MDYRHYFNNPMATWIRHILYAWWFYPHLTYSRYCYSNYKNN